MVREGGRFVTLAVAALAIVLITLAHAEAGAPGGADELAHLIDSTRAPLPIVPVVVPQVVNESDVGKLLATSTRPILFQISQAKGASADPAQIRFFQLLSIEYALKIDFRKVAAGSPAGLRLYPKVSKPVYILCAASAKRNSHNCFFLNEAGLPEGRLINQTMLEKFIFKHTGIVPAVLTTFALTPNNYKEMLFAHRSSSARPSLGDTPIVVLFFRGGKAIPGAVNRLRELLALERFFYNKRLRIAECDLSTASAVYKALIPGAGEIPSKPELWLIEPVTHHAKSYAENGNTQPLLQLTQADFQGWLARNGVPSPPDAAIDTARAWPALNQLEKQSN